MPGSVCQLIFMDLYQTGELLVVMDTYSRYPEVEIVNRTSVAETIPMFEKIFATHRIPSELKTDNGPPFQSESFQAFAEEKVSNNGV